MKFFFLKKKKNSQDLKLVLVYSSNIMKIKDNVIEI
jgi:hypothetical protein